MRQSFGIVVMLVVEIVSQKVLDGSHAPSVGHLQSAVRIQSLFHYEHADHFQVSIPTVIVHGSKVVAICFCSRIHVHVVS